MCTNKKKTAKEAKLMKKTTATQQSYFSPHNLLFPVSWPWAWWQEWVSHVQSDPPILSLAWQTHTFSHTHIYILLLTKTRLKQKKTLQSNSLISAPKQNEAPWNNERAERRRCRNADRNETVIRSYHFLITQRVCAGAGDGVENRRLFCILIRRLIHTLYCYSFDYNRPACLPAPLSAFTEPHAAHETSVTPLPPLKLINQQFSQFL